MNKKRLIAGVLVCVAIMAGTAACSSYNDARGKGDAPVFQRHGDDSPAYVTNMPDDFGNIAAKCLAGFPGEAVMVTTKKISMPFPYAGCDGKGDAPATSR